MQNFDIKTHRIGETYSKPNFFILNKGLNSGKPLLAPCSNCFVITTQSKEFKESLFYLCMSLKIGKYFGYYLKGSVIPFICIADAQSVIKTALQNFRKNQWDQKIEKLKKITVFEENLKLQLKTISNLKIALIRS